MRNYIKRQSIRIMLMCFFVTSCAAYNPEPIKGLLFHGAGEHQSEAEDTADHEDADAKAKLEQALIEQDRDTMSALIRSAIGYLH